MAPNSAHHRACQQVPILLSDREQQLYRLFIEIGIIDQLGRTRLEQAMPSGLTRAQFGVLNHLVRLGGEWAPLRLARAFHVTKQTMTSTLARLESAGLIIIRPDPADGRAKLVGLTPAGHEAHLRCMQRLGPTLALMIDGLPKTLAESLLPLLMQLRTHLDQGLSPDS